MLFFSLLIVGSLWKNDSRSFPSRLKWEGFFTICGEARMDRNEIQQILAFTREKIDQQLQDLEVDLLQKLECQSDYNKHTRNQVYINLTTTISYSEVEQLFFDYGTITMISIKANLLTIVSDPI